MHELAYINEISIVASKDFIRNDATFFRNFLSFSQKIAARL